jgi:hypothetical protein
MTQDSKKQVILIKTEATPGTDATPTGSDAVLVKSLEITPVSSDTVSRNLVRPYFGNSPMLLANTKVEVSFEVELAGSGTAGTAPRYGPALLASGLAATTVASTSVTYWPVSDNFSTATIYFHADKIRHIVTGARGSFSISAKVGEVPTIKFQFTGQYNSPTDASSGAVTYSNQIDPLIFRQGNTSAFSIFGYSGAMSSFEFDIANEIVYRELIGGTKETKITGRMPAGTVMIEAPTIAAKDFYSIAVGSATGALTFLHGTTAGNRFTFNSSTVDVTAPKYQDENGILHLSIPYVAVPTTAGNDEFSLAFT